MNSSRPDSPRAATGASWHADSAAARFERAWQQGAGPDLVSFVADLPEISAAELATLICMDLDARWQQMLPKAAEDYLRAFPAVATDPELAVDVIYAEYLAREQTGEEPKLSDFKQRFPHHAAVLEEQVRLHQALLPAGAAQEAKEGTAENDASVSMNVNASYRIIEQIGSGGMGVVYKAHQPALNRYVALKMVRLIDAENQSLLARFRAEAQVVASLRHPHIVQVYDYGEHEGLPYFAMELIEGGTLADHLHGNPWPARIAAELLAKLAGAVQFAHDQRVIHRDLKPANVLIVAERPQLEMKITDFGLAKFFMENASRHNTTHAFLGTPSYMAPEQANGRIREVGVGADIYSLGAILYELLTGRPPIRGESPIETLRLLLCTEPVSIHRLAPSIPRDLATICEKCLRSDPARRYPSAAALRDDLERYLTDKPIAARPVSAGERIWRWSRRNPTLAGALGSVAVLLALVTAVSLWYSTQLSHELARVQSAESATQEAMSIAENHLLDAYIAEATALTRTGQVGQRFAALTTVDKALSLWNSSGRTVPREAQLRNIVLAAAALPDLEERRRLAAWPKAAYAGALSAKGQIFVFASDDGMVTAYRLSDGEHLWQVQAAEPEVQLAISPDARWIAFLGKRTTQVWGIANEPRLAWEQAQAEFFTFSPDGQYVAFGDPETKRTVLASAENGEAIRTLREGLPLSLFAFHPAGKSVALCDDDGVAVVELDSGKTEFNISDKGVRAQRLAWHPSGDFLAVWSKSEGVDLWNVKTHEKAIYFAHHGLPSQLVFTADGLHMASHSQWDDRLQVWDCGTGERVLEIPEFSQVACDITDDGRILFLCRRNDSLGIAEFRAAACRPLARQLYPPLAYWANASIAPEGRLIAFSSHVGFELWDRETTRRLASWPLGSCNAQFDSQGRLILALRWGVYRFPRHIVTAIAAQSGPAASPQPTQLVTTVQFGPPERLSEFSVPTSVAIDGAGESLLFQDEHGWAIRTLQEPATFLRLHTEDDPRKGAISALRQSAVIANWEAGGAGLWNLTSGEQVAKLSIGRHGVVQFSPDGQLLAASPDGVTVWSTNDWQCIQRLRAFGTTPTGLGMAFSPDSRVLAVGQLNGILALVDPRSGSEWARLSRRGLSVASMICFSSDQRWLLTASNDERSTVYVWDWSVLRHELAERNLDLPADVLRINTDPAKLVGPLSITLDGGSWLSQ